MDKNKIIPHVLITKEGKRYDIVDMTTNQAKRLNYLLKAEKSIYRWAIDPIESEGPVEDHHALRSANPIDDIEWTKAVHPGVKALIQASGHHWIDERLERDPGGPGRAADRAGAIADDLSREMCFFDFNFRAVLRDLPDEALETLEAIIARAKKERSPQG